MDVDDHLARFRPVAPPPGLREKVLEACRSRQRSRSNAWPFAAAAAALLLLALANVAIERRLAAAIPSPLPESPAPVVEQIGNEALSRRLIVHTRAATTSPQSLLRLRLEIGRSSS